MGNQSSLEEHHEFKNITNNYVYEKKYNDSRFGEVKLLREKETGVKIFQKDLTSNTKKDYEEYAKEIRRRASIQHPNLLKILGFSSKREDMFCADFFKVSLFFESFEEDLEQEIYSRKENKGWRLDYFIVNKEAIKAVKSTDMYKDVPGSDHCPTELIFDLSAL